MTSDFDDLAKFNRERWDDLARSGIEYSVPALGLDEASARQMVDPAGRLGPLMGKRVLCLAAGGGQQSAAFGLLGANVTVLDLSPVQLERDALACRNYGLTVRLEQGDMRDLSRFDAGSFDIVWQAHALNFVPDPQAVFGEVSRVLATSGLYHLEFTNPFIHGTWESSWTGSGYLLAGPYGDAEIQTAEEPWTFSDAEGVPRKVAGPREFRHTLSSIINGLISSGFRIQRFSEDGRGDAHAAPGTWRHFVQFAAPWFTIVAQRG